LLFRFKKEQRKTPISPTVIRFTAAQIVVSHRRKQKKGDDERKRKENEREKESLLGASFLFSFCARRFHATK